MVLSPCPPLSLRVVFSGCFSSRKSTLCQLCVGALSAPFPFTPHLPWLPCAIPGRDVLFGFMVVGKNFPTSEPLRLARRLCGAWGRGNSPLPTPLRVGLAGHGYRTARPPPENWCCSPKWCGCLGGFWYFSRGFGPPFSHGWEAHRTRS